MFEDLIGPSPSEKQREIDNIIEAITCPGCNSNNLTHGLSIPSDKDYIYRRAHCSDCKASFFIIWKKDFSRVYIEMNNKIIPVKGRS